MKSPSRSVVGLRSCDTMLSDFCDVEATIQINKTVQVFMTFGVRVNILEIPKMVYPLQVGAGICVVLTAR